jgi:hypothetical protein
MPMVAPGANDCPLSVDIANRPDVEFCADKY